MSGDEELTAPLKEQLQRTRHANVAIANERANVVVAQRGAMKVVQFNAKFRTIGRSCEQSCDMAVVASKHVVCCSLMALRFVAGDGMRADAVCECFSFAVVAV